MSTDLGSSVEQVVTADLDALSVAELQAHVLDLQAAVGRLSGRVDQVLAVVQERSGGQVPENPDSTGAPLLLNVQTWWRESVRVHGSQAGRDLRRAATLRRLPAWGQAVVDGVLTPAQAQVLCRLDGKLPETELLASQAELVTLASEFNPVDLAHWVRHLIATWSEPDLDAEQDKADRRAWLQLDRRPDGRLAGRFVISSEDSEALLTVLEPLARRQGLSDARTAGQRRADALVEVFTAAARWMELPETGGRPTHVSYVVPSGWACGDTPPSLSELLTGGYLDLVPVRTAAGTATCGDDTSTPVARRPEQPPWPAPHWQLDHRPHDRPSVPTPGRITKRLTDPMTGAELHPVVVEEHVATAAWSGPQTRARIEATLCDARISRVLRDSLGQITSLQSLTDQITTAQRRAVSARDRHCTARGCTRPPGFTDVHHLIHRDDGGTTCVDNLVLLCRRHHLMWHRGRLTLADLHTPWLHEQQAA